MGTQVNGNPANVLPVLPAAVAIVSSTASGTITMTTAAHGMTDGDYVTIAQHDQAAANGTWQAHVLSPTQFQLASSTGSGTPGTAVGTAQPINFGSTYTIPSDGVDNENAASVNVPFEATGDRTAALLVMTGGLKVCEVPDDYNNDDTLATWNSFTIASLNTWTDTNSSSVNTPLVPQMVHVNDVVQVSMSLTEDVSVSPLGTLPFANYFMISLWYSLDAGTSWARVDGSTRTIDLWSDAAGGQNHFTGSSISMSGVITSTATTNLYVKIMGMFRTAGLVSQIVHWNLIGDWNIQATLYRPTGLGQ